MTLSKKQLEASAYIFEKANGIELDTYQENLIANANLNCYGISELEMLIIKGLNNNSYNESIRVSAYFALSKRFNTALVAHFKKWLKEELNNNHSNNIYQLMIALQNLDEPIFNPKRTGSSFFETELNIRDVKRYLIIK